MNTVTVILCIVGSLDDALKLCRDRRLPEERVVFYSAEIVLAISHMHRMGFMYRDLKPKNVLLMGSGHIKLVDMGGVIDPQERVLKHDIPEKAIEFFQDYNLMDESLSPSSDNDSRRDVRASSVMGTRG